MTQYVDKSLAADEQILMRGRWPVAYWVGAYAQLLILGWIVVGIFLYLRAVIRMTTTEFAVTDRRIIMKSGWIRRITHELSVQSIEGVHVDQSLWGRLFRYGRLVVTGNGEARIFLPPMGEPIEFRRAIEDARARAREVHLSGEAQHVVEEAAASHLAAAHAEKAPPPAPETARPEASYNVRRPKRFVGLFGS